MMENTMEERIRLIIKAKNISAAVFADKIGVQRSAVSHILSGRNNPSLDFVQRILKTYPDINTDWLMSGKGEMRKDLLDLFNEHIKTNDDGVSSIVSTNDEIKSEEVVVPTLFDLPVEKVTLIEEIKAEKMDEPIIESQKEVEVLKTPEIKQAAIPVSQPKMTEPILEQVQPATPVAPVQPIQTKVEAAVQPKVETEKKPDIFFEKDIERIVVFYKDRTFREYRPD